MGALDFSVLSLDIEPDRHTTGRLIPDFRCLIILVLNRHGIMSEEYDKLSLGLDEFKMKWTLV